MEAKITKYYTLSGMNAVNLGKFWRKIFVIFKIKLSFLTDNLSRTQLKTAQKSVRSVDHGFLTGTQVPVLFGVGSKGSKTVRLSFDCIFMTCGFNQFKEQTAMASHPP